MRRFVAGGFAATAMRDLGDAMGLGQASVYNAFGGKRALFTQCLDRYLDANMKARIARVEQSLPPRLAIETFLAEIVEVDVGRIELAGAIDQLANFLAVTLGSLGLQRLDLLKIRFV